MKQIMKQLLALSLALIVAFTFTPVNAQAAGRKVTFSTSGKVKTVMYKGAKAKTGTFTLISTKNPTPYVMKNGTLYQQSKNEADLPVYYKYEVSMTIRNPRLTKNDVVKTIQEINKKKYDKTYNVFCPVFIDANGNDLDVSNLKINGGFSSSDSSKSKTLSARSGRKRYYMYNYRTVNTYNYTVYAPATAKDIYFGFAGLRNGQLKKKTRSKFKSGKIDYYGAGFGNKKKGYIIAGSIFQ